MRSKSVVGTIGPSITVGKTSMGIVGETGIAIVTSVTSIVAQSVTVVTTIQNSGIGLGLGLSLRGSLDGTEQSNRQLKIWMIIYASFLARFQKFSYPPLKFAPLIFSV